MESPAVRRTQRLPVLPALLPVAVVLVVLVAAAPALAGCQADDATEAGASVAAGGSGFPSLVAPAFARRMSDPGTVLLDVRTPEEFAAGHIEGARNIDLEGGDLEATVETLDPQATYAVYCHSDRRSSAAMRLMADHGVTDVYDLEGGMRAWQAYGGTVTD